MSWFSNAIDNVNNFFTGEKDASDKADSLREQAASIKNKSVSELQNEGRAAAGQAAADKAGEAKKQAKAASMQTNGNRLAAATNAAGAAANASSEGYDTASQGYAQMAEAQDQAEKTAQRNALTSQADAIDNRTAQKKATQQALASSAMNMVGSLASDSNKKCVKHTYIPADKRYKREEK